MVCICKREVPLYIHRQNVHAGVCFPEFGASCVFGTGWALRIAGSSGFNNITNNREKKPT